MLRVFPRFACALRTQVPLRSFAVITRYTKSHEWVKVDGQSATVGITDHACSLLGDIVHVEFPKKGASFKAGESFGTVESVKAASDIYAPISGDVIDVNAEMDPSSANFKPSDWMVRFAVKDASEINNLLDESAYQQHCKEH